MTRNKLPAVLIFSMFFSIGALVSLPVSAKLYKWVDDNGVTHYGETIPPEYANKDRAELSKSGRVIKKQEVLTPDELRAQRLAKEQEDAKTRAEAQAALEKVRRDKALTDTYSNSSEIELARKRNLQQVELRINGITANLKMADSNVLSLQNEAETYSKANKEIPKDLQEDLQEAQARLTKLQKDMEKAQAEMAAINARYDADKARYKELTGK